MRLKGRIVLYLVSCALAEVTSALPQAGSLDGVQQILRESNNEACEAVLPIRNIDYSTYTTTIGVGTPPQNFTAIIDIAWSDAWLPSIHCPEESYEEDCAVHPLFNGSASRTYGGTDQRVMLHNGGFYTGGSRAFDVFHIGAISGITQVFEEASDVRPTYFFDDDWYDTVLPLARTTVPEHMDSNLSVPSVFQNMQAQGCLSRNVMGIRLPATERSTGELRIGGISPDVKYSKQSYVRLPIVKEVREPTADSTQYTRGGWYVEPVSVTLESNPPVHFDLAGHIASLETAVPLIVFPTAFMDRMYDSLGSDEMELPCADMYNLPNLTVALRGEGGLVHNFTLTGPDYLREKPHVPFTDPGNCILFATGLWQTPDDVPPFVILGSLFLRKFYTILDADEMMISLYPLSI